MSPVRFAVFLTVASAIVGSLHYYLWIRLVRDAHWNPAATQLLTTLFIVLGMLVPLSLPLSRFVPRALASPVAWVAYTWMGLASLLLFLLVPLDFLRGTATLLLPADPARRVALSRLVAFCAGGAGLALSALGLASALSRVRVVPVRIPLAKLPAALDGYVIVQLSDVHVGPTIGREFMEQIVRTANDEHPDMVVITGDLVDGSVAQLGHLVEPLRELRAKDGVFFVTGNHEYYSGADEWIAHLGTLGVRVLRNERVPIGGDAGFDLAGVDDHSAHQFGNGHGTDLPKALGGRDPSRVLVLLAHQPKTIVGALEHGIDLQLSGHTHGGQIWPWGYLVRLDQPHVAGLSRHGAAIIYVSRGTGYWGPPMRVASPAEITRVVLATAGA